jgi:hypothetical protein
MEAFLFLFHRLPDSSLSEPLSKTSEFAAASRIITRKAMEDESKNPSETVKMVFLFLLAGIAVLIGLMVLTYLMALLADRLDRQTADREVDRSPVTRKANLWGLQISERREILKDIFANTTTRFQNAIVGAELEMVTISKQQSMNDTEQLNDTSTNNGTTLDPVDTERTSSVDIREMCDEEKAEPVHESIEPLDDTDHEKMCCICLIHYEEGDSIMTGTICKHVFHEKCCLLWLEKNDHCPYCRNRMMRFTEFRAAAIRVLGEKRVKELSAQSVDDSGQDHL